MNLINAITTVNNVWRKDKIILLFSFLPVLIGVLLYILMGKYVFMDFMGWGKEWIESQISSKGWSSFFYHILVGIFSIFFFFLVNWTFVLVVSIIASPFNDIISERVEKAIAGREANTIGESFSRLMSRLGFTLINELKKVAFILTLSGLALLLNFIPMLAPLSIILSAILMAVSFLDYSWSRHDMKFRACVGEVRNSIIVYTFAGGAFMFLISVPLLNLLALPYGVMFFTVLFCRKNVISNQVLEV
jgi:CysZ protein